MSLLEPASWQVRAMGRAVAAAGGFLTVLLRGSAQGRSLVVVHRHQGRVRAWERLPALEGPGTVWRLAADGESEVERFLNRQKGFDPELWAVELDVPDPARFVADLSSSG